MPRPTRSRCSRTWARRRTGSTGRSPSCSAPGWFDGVRGIVCGHFSDCGDPAVVRALLVERLGALGVPLVLDAPVGHERTNLPLPLGVRARLDADPAGVGRLSVPG